MQGVAFAWNFVGKLSLVSHFNTNPIAPVTNEIVSAFISYILVISISRSLYLDSFSVAFTEICRFFQMVRPCKLSCTSCLFGS